MTDAASPIPGLRWAAILALLLALILVPFALFGGAMDHWAPSALRSSGLGTLAVGALVVGLLAADVVLPVPSSVVATMSGALLGLATGALASFLGLTIGLGLGYWLGRSAGRAGATRMLGEREVHRLDGLVGRHGAWAIVATRAVPVLAEGVTVVAGMGSMPIGRFLLAGSVSNLGLALAYALVGARAARVDSFLLAFAGSVVLPGAAMAIVAGIRRER